MANPFRTSAEVYAPAGGLDLAGEFYAGGEALHPEDLAVLRPQELRHLMQGGISRQDHAQQAYLHAASPPKDPEEGQESARVGRPRARSYDDPPLVAPPQKGKARARPATPEEGRALLPEEVRGDVSDREVMKLTRQGAARFVEVFNRLPSDKEIATAARLGEGKRGWYRDAANAILYLFGPDAPRFTALLAATSPVKAVHDNLRNALSIWTAYNRARAKKGAPLSRNETATLIMRHSRQMAAAGYRQTTMESEFNNVFRALAGKRPERPEALSGPKVDSFRANLLYDLHEVTNDTWMAALYGLQQSELGGKSEAPAVDKGGGLNPDTSAKGTISPAYAAASAKARRVARVLNRGLSESDIADGARPWTPAEVQETTWSAFRTLAYLQGHARRKARRKGGDGATVPTGPEALDLLTHELVQNNADFVTLLVKDEFARHQLEQIGLGEGLARLAEVHAETQARRGAPSGAAAAGLQGDAEALEAARTVARRAGTRSKSFESTAARLGKAGWRRRLGRRRRFGKGGGSFRGKHTPDDWVSWHDPAAPVNAGSPPPTQEVGPPERKIDPRLARVIGSWRAGATEQGVLSHHLHSPTGHQVHLTHFPRDGRDPEMLNLDFSHPALEADEAAASLQPGTLAFLRHLQDLLHAIHAEDMAVSYQPADEQRDRIYQRAMRRAGFERDLSGASPYYQRWAPSRGARGKYKRGRKRRKYARPEASLPGASAPAPAPQPQPQPQPQPAALMGVSDNTDTALSFDQALKRAGSGNKKVFLQAAEERMEQIGLRGKSYSAVGDWEDGAEDAVLREVDPSASWADLEYAAAWYGLLGNQKQALVFRPQHSGTDSVYSVHVPETNVGRVREQLSRAGVAFRTIVPGRKGSRVVVYDQGRRHRDNVAVFAGKYNAVIHESVGVGQYIGGGSRADARRRYREIITRYEAARQPGGGGDAVRPPPSQGPGGLGGTPAQAG